MVRLFGPPEYIHNCIKGLGQREKQTLIHSKWTHCVRYEHNQRVFNWFSFLWEPTLSLQSKNMLGIFFIYDCPLQSSICVNVSSLFNLFLLNPILTFMNHPYNLWLKCIILTPTHPPVLHNSVAEYSKHIKCFIYSQLAKRAKRVYLTNVFICFPFRTGYITRFIQVICR